MINQDKPMGKGLLSNIRRLAASNRGATSIEYAVACLVIAVPVAATLPAIASTVKSHYNQTAAGFDVNNKPVATGSSSGSTQTPARDPFS